MDCLFCSITEKKIPSDILYEDEHVLAFRDIAPQAPVHVLVIPKRHIATINDVSDDDNELMGRLINTARRLAAELGLSEDGYRLLFNVNQHGGQAVYHIHLHLVGGRQMAWPPG